MDESLKGTTVTEPKPTKKCSKSEGGQHLWNYGMHIDMKDRAITNFHCDHCKETVTQTYYRDDSDPFMWMD
jgi:hypothetical protein